MSKTTWRVFGIPIFSIEYELDDREYQLHIRNTSGQFELAEVEDDEYDEDYEEDSGFGFRS